MNGGPARRPVDAEPIWEALRRVVDPEIGLDVVTLGLVYAVEREGGEVVVRHSLTTPGCPMGEVIARGIEAAAGSVPGVESVRTELVWDPPWDPGMIRDHAWREEEA